MLKNFAAEPHLDKENKAGPTSASRELLISVNQL